MASPKKLKVGLILDTSLDPYDGVQQYVVCVGEWLAAQGHNVHYLVGETKKRQLPNIHSLARNVSVNFNGNRTTIPLPAKKIKLKKLIKTERFDVLHVQTPHHPLMAQHLIMAASDQTAVVGTFHISPYGWLSKTGNRLLGIWLRPSLKRIDKLLAVSPAAASFARQSFGMNAEILPNVISYTSYHGAKPFSKYRDGRQTILFLGRLVPRKGCKLLLEAVAELVKRSQQAPEFKVVICGDGPMAGSLKDYVKIHNLESLVEFTGFVNEQDKPRYYASADIAVFPSSSGESFGIVLLEAMSAGAGVVIGGNNPGYATVLGGRTELLFDTKSSEPLADKLKILLRGGQQVKSLHDWQQKEVKKYDINVVGLKLVDVYRTAIASRRQKRHN